MDVLLLIALILFIIYTVLPGHAIGTRILGAGLVFLTAGLGGIRFLGIG